MALKDSFDLIRAMEHEQPCSIAWLSNWTGWPRKEVSRRMTVLQMAGIAKGLGPELYQLTEKADVILKFLDVQDAFEAASQCRILPTKGK